MYLNGTVHLVQKNFFPLKERILNCLYKYNNFVLEVKDESINNVIIITNDIIYNNDYIYEDGDSLYNHFPKDKIINLRRYLVKNKLCSREIERKFYKLKPEVIEILLLSERYNQAGAAHLIGEDSIIDRLEKKGYEIIRIC
nr:TraB/GumN family protein [uncultured Clostridium sp.]